MPARADVDLNCGQFHGHPFRANMAVRAPFDFGNTPLTLFLKLAAGSRPNLHARCVRYAAQASSPAQRDGPFQSPVAARTAGRRQFFSFEPGEPNLASGA